MNKPTQEYGYILIDTDEKKAQFAPKREGDQHFTNCGSWENCCCATDHLHRDVIYRRPISPGDGWELVPEAELADLRPADCEYKFFSGNCNDWCPLSNDGRSLLDWRNCADYMLAFSRPKSPQTGWVKCSERLPEEFRLVPVQVEGWQRTSQGWLVNGRWDLLESASECDLKSAVVVGWYDLPAPPASTPAEKAWEEFLPNMRGDLNIRTAFIAGFEKGAAK